MEDPPEIRQTTKSVLEGEGGHQARLANTGLDSMLDIEKMKRPTAAQTAIAIRKFYQDFETTTCEACGRYIPFKK